MLWLSSVPMPSMADPVRTEAQLVVAVAGAGMAEVTSAMRGAVILDFHSILRPETVAAAGLYRGLG